MKFHKTVVKEIPIENIFPGRYQPRKHFDENELNALTLSIQQQGIIQPLVITPINDYQYEIIAGERRWRASQKAQLDNLPCIIKTCSHEIMAAIALMENIHRSNLNPLEEAKAYQRLIVEFDYTQEELALLLGINRTTLTHKMRLLLLDPKVQKRIEENLLTEGHAKVIVSLSPKEQIFFSDKCLQYSWSVRQLEQEIKKTKKKNQEKYQLKSADLTRLEGLLEEQLCTSVKLINNVKKRSGWLKIHYADYEILEGLLEKLGIKYN
ncbi:MAG: putative chromosome-partitioning protein ParB [Legionellaceae bacterium]